MTQGSSMSAPMTTISDERLAERVETKLRERAGFMRDAGHIDDAELDEDAANLIHSLRAAQPATPPVDGLEVVAHAYVVEGECEQIGWGSDVLLPDDSSLVELTPLSQASSVIAGLKEEKQYWWEKAHEENGLRVHLEEENKRLRETLKPFASYAVTSISAESGAWVVRIPDNAMQPAFSHFSAARQALEEHNV